MQKKGPHAAYNAYKECVRKDTTALFLAAAMEHFGLQDVTGKLALGITFIVDKY